LTKPTLYLSDFFERNRPDYYDALTLVRTKGDIEHWLKFFLVGVAQTAANSKQTFEKIIELRRECEQKIILMGKRARSAQQLLPLLYSKPITNPNTIAEILGITHQSANTLIRGFEEVQILEEITGYKRNRLFMFKKYVDIFNDDITETK